MKFYAKKQNGCFLKNFDNNNQISFFSLDQIKTVLGESSYRVIPTGQTLYGYELLKLYEAQPVFDHMPKYFIYSVQNFGGETC